MPSYSGSASRNTTAIGAAWRTAASLSPSPILRLARKESGSRGRLFRFYGAAHPGDWLEARTDVTRVGRQVAFNNCYLCVGESVVARASGVFNVRDGSPLTKPNR